MTSQPYKPGESVLIAGGSGLIGRYLTSVLLEQGFTVSHLSRKQDNFGRVRVYRWDPGKGIANPAYFEGVKYIINLSGANIGETRWTKRRKAEIVRSRIESTLFLHKIVTENKIPLKAYISASATGFYGSAISEKIFTESDPPAEDFLASVCRKWEEAADSFAETGIRTVKIRTAMVLEKSDSALRRILIPASFGFLAGLGKGKQYMPWIHIADACGIYLRAVNDESMSGAYNAAAPQQITHDVFMKTLGSVIKKPVLPFNIPSWVLYPLLGEMSDVVLKGSRVSSEKIISNGYSFVFGKLEDALRDLLKPE